MGWDEEMKMMGQRMMVRLTGMIDDYPWYSYCGLISLVGFLFHDGWAVLVGSIALYDYLTG